MILLYSYSLKDIIGLSTIPCDILPITQKPDIVVINRDMQIIILIELTVCIEANIKGAQSRNKNCYASLLSDLEDRNYDAKLLTIAIGSRGYIDSHNANMLKSILKLYDPKVKYLNET